MCTEKGFHSKSSHQTASRTKQAPITYAPDYSSMIGSSDLHYKGKLLSGTQGMPVANGRFGGPVWQGSGSSIFMQLNHTDTFMFNDASAASGAHINSGGGALGRVCIGFGSHEIFDDSTEYHLSLYEGRLSISGSRVQLQVIADMDSDAIAFQVTDNRAKPTSITIDLVMLRDAVQIWGEHHAVSTLIAADDKQSVTLAQEISEQCDTGLTVNDFYCHTAVAVTIRDREISAIHDSFVGVRSSKRIVLPAQNGTFSVIIGGDSHMDRTAEVRAKALENASRPAGYDSISEASRTWWERFWSRSFVFLPSKKEFEQRRNYFMYLSAISNRGSYPSKYNGGIWISEEDRRDWGSFYWNWNQDPLYQPLADANHLELLDPMFHMRQSCLEQYKTAAKQLWGAEGVFIGETSGILGWETLPDDVAGELRDYYVTATASCTQRIQDFGSKRNSYLIPWNWKLSFKQDDRRVGFVTHSLVATQETAEYFWQRYRYTKDICWLRDHAYPFIRGAAELYRTYPGFRKEDDGKYHFNRTHLHEHIWAGRDVIDDLSLARGIFSIVVEASCS